MDWDHKPLKILITGKSGSGKTTLWLKRVAESRANYLFVFDPDLEFSAKSGHGYVSDFASGAYCLKNGLPVIFDSSDQFPGDRLAGFDLFCEWVYRMCKILPGRKILAVDELQKFVPKSPAYVPASFQVILDEGRRFSLDLILVSRRPNLVNEAVRAEMTEVIAFQHTDKNPLAWLEADGFDPGQVRGLAFPGGHISRQL